jgi:hypothetical protein
MPGPKPRQSRRAAVAAFSCLALAGGLVAPVAADEQRTAANMVPEYEVKLLLDPDVVLDADNQLISDVHDAFDLPQSYQVRMTQYHDTDDLEINEEGWIVRMRRREGQDDDRIRLTYRKRYPILDGDIDAALDQANADGFTAEDTNYDAEVDWGYQNQTLSISRDKNEPTDLPGLDMPAGPAARDILIDRIPGKMDRWGGSGWGSSMLEGSRVYGPVELHRYIGEWEGHDVQIEVTAMRDEAGTGEEYFAEASFDTADFDEATDVRAGLIDELDRAGWFLPEDALKTQLVLSRY